MSIYNIAPVTVDDYRAIAKRRLPRFLFDYIDGGANREEILARNCDDFSQIALKQRVLRDVDSVDTSTTLFGRSLAMPVALAPVGMAGLFRRRGETQAARAAERCGIPFTTSTVGICPVDEVAASVAEPIWFQLYMLRDRDFILELLERASNAGVDTLLFTVDLPVAGMRQRDFRNGMLGGGIPGKISKLAQLLASPQWVYDVGIKGKPHTFGNVASKVEDPSDLDLYKTFIDGQFDPTVTWDDIAWLRQQWKGKLIIKGVMEADDARAAVDCGAEGIIISNHGGRQLDGISSSIAKLPSVATAVNKQCALLIDSGIRNGIDVVKSIALGADAVLMGRPWVYAMAAHGEQGVVDLMQMVNKEIEIAMALMGVNRIDEINSDLIDKDLW
ncbi:L-lactate dehydrogenase [Porticoccaceae bacterium]|nr:L-lactate dehydrogenase [Porticoccaceae bacterium]